MGERWGREGDGGKERMGCRNGEVECKVMGREGERNGTVSNSPISFPNVLTPHVLMTEYLLPVS